MTAVYPDVFVHKKKHAVPRSAPGMAGKVAIVGAFDSEATTAQAFADLDSAYTALGTDATNFKGCSCLDKIFTGASSIIAVNITTWTGSGAEKTAQTELTTTKLTNALALIKSEDFDILFIADDIADTAFPIITAFLEAKFTKKLPAGFIGGITRSTTSDYTASLALAGDQCYGIIPGQQWTVNGTTYTVVDSAAYWCGLVAGMSVGNSMTKKVVPGVTGVNPELTFENGDAGISLMGAGGLVLECQDRVGRTYNVVNSEQPNNLDLYINRVRDYVVKEMSLYQFLGNRNDAPTLSEVQQECDRVRYNCVNTLNLLADIEYNIVRKSSSCVDIHINKLLFDGIITTINVYVTVEVQ